MDYEELKALRVLSTPERAQIAALIVIYRMTVVGFHNRDHVVQYIEGVGADKFLHPLTDALALDCYTILDAIRAEVRVV